MLSNEMNSRDYVMLWNESERLCYEMNRRDYVMKWIGEIMLWNESERVLSVAYIFAFLQFCYLISTYLILRKLKHADVSLFFYFIIFFRTQTFLS